MDILFLLIPLSVVLVFVIGWAFWWSVRAGSSTTSKVPRTASSPTTTRRV